MRKIIYGAAGIIVILIMFIFADILGIGGSKNNIDIKVENGAGASVIAEKLKKADIISYKAIFKIYSRLTGEHIYQMGTHKLNPSMSYKEIIRNLQSVPENDEVQVLIPEGYELRQIADVLEENGLINREVFMSEVETGNFDYEFIKNIPNRNNRLEGYLFPDTYKFSKNETEHEIIDKMLSNFDKQVVPLYQQSGCSMSLDDIVILASVIEREAASDNDRGKVASVFVNRINMGMKLESCATVQYILKERKNVLSIEDTKIESPYNTYINEGLPIGPIASPGISSINSAIYPEQTNYIYFLATENGTDSLFSETFEEHLENQKRIQGNE